MTPPRVSVCVPTYRGAATLAATLGSVLAQDCDGVEVVVADDASDDATVEVARSVDDRRVRVLAAPHHLGPAANWDRAVTAATGAHLKVMGQDDLLLPGCLAAQVAVLHAEPGVTLVTCRRDVVGPDDRVLFAGRGLGGLLGRVEGPAALRAVVRSGTNPLGEPVAGLVRSADARALGGFRSDLPYVIDLDWWCRLLERGALWGLGETLVAFRVSPSSWSVALAAEQSRQVRALFAELRARHPRTVSRADLVRGSARARAAAVARRAVYARLARTIAAEGRPEGGHG